ncbi:hypothetical protein [Brevundimonas naejangsanensis]|uniref:hypothetical protein n=1 Tax=Brevundimonas naejangsanensis TaxID=588932 RepID=UPI001968C21D|nr:hypothetical protein [Brevundimonas naejangsanensis]
MRKALGASAVAALIVGGGYASLQVAGDAGLTLPGGFALAPQAEEAASGDAGTPIAALALDGAPTDAVPSPDVAATEGAALFARAAQMLDNGDDSGLEPLIRAANLGYAPAQLRLAVLYQDGGRARRRMTPRRAPGPAAPPRPASRAPCISTPCSCMTGSAGRGTASRPWPG